MKKCLFIFLAVLAVASAARFPPELGPKFFAELSNLIAKQPDLKVAVADDPYEDKFMADNEARGEFDTLREEMPIFEDPEQLGWILNHEGKKKVRNVIDTMPCGWPEYGVPPLAPYRREQLTLDLKKSFVETVTDMIRFRIDGLDQMVINKLKISYTFSKKVKYNFVFPKIRISGKYATDTLVNLMEEYGVSVRYEGNGDFDITLENLTLDGTFKYKMPWIFGSIKIYNFNIMVTLGNVVSNINGLMGNGRANHMINEEVEDVVLWSVNGNQKLISTKIEETLVPNVNAKLKGHKIWYVLGGMGGSSTCVPPPDPWA